MGERNLRTVKSALDLLAKTYGWTDKLNEHRAIDFFEKSLDPLVLKHIEKLYIKDKKIFIHLNNAAAKNNLAYQVSELKLGINKFLGVSYIQDIVVV